jgi:hypothetical protein
MDVTLSDGLRVTLYDRLDFQRATTVTKAIAFIEETDPAVRPALVLATLSEFYVLMGVESWSDKEPVTSANIRRKLLAHPDVGTLVEAADELYQEQILLPLVNRASSSSPPSQTDASTSATPRGAKRPPKPLKPSSISTIPTDATAETSSPPDGAYSSSQSLELAG